MNKNEQLNALRTEIGGCEECMAAGWGTMVFGEGDPNARVMFVGEAPGRREAETGRPFVGPSGKLLRKMIRDSGLTEEEVYITSPVKFFPHKGTPTKKEIAHSRYHFAKQIDIVNPEIIVLMGKSAMAAVLDRDGSVMKDHGNVFVKGGRKMMVTIHPAAVLRFRKNESILVEDFKKVTELVTPSSA